MIIKESEIRKLVIKKLLESVVADNVSDDLSNFATGAAAFGGTAVGGAAGYGAIQGLRGGAEGLKMAAGSGIPTYAATAKEAGKFAVAKAGTKASTTGALAKGALAGSKHAVGSLKSGVKTLSSFGWKGKALAVAPFIAAGLYNMWDVADKEELVELIIDGGKCAEMKAFFEDMARNYEAEGQPDAAKMILTQPEYMDDAKIKTASDALYDATIGGGINVMSGKGLFGMGTDEEAIKDVIDGLPSALDMCAVAAKFKKDHNEDLGEVLRAGELSDSDYKTYVSDPLKAKVEECFIVFLGKPMGISPWTDYAKATDKILKDIEETLGGLSIDPQVPSGGRESSADVNVVTTSESDPWEYKVSQDTGCWLTRKKEDAPMGAWKSLGRNRRATRILDRQFPNARAEDEKAACPGTGGGGSGGSGGGGRGQISPKGAKETEDRARVASPRRMGASDIRVEVVLRANSDITTLDQLCGSGATQRFVKDVIMGRLREKLRTGGKANVFNSDETINIAVDFNRGGNRVKSVKRIKGSEAFQLMKFSDIRGAIERFFNATMPVKNTDNVSNPARNRRDIPDLELRVMMPAGVYSSLNETKELIKLIRKMAKK